MRTSDSGPRPDGTPLLLVNGIGANLEMWEPLRRRLVRRSLAVDLPGTGGTVDVLRFSFGGSVAQDSRAWPRPGCDG